MTEYFHASMVPPVYLLMYPVPVQPFPQKLIPSAFYGVEYMSCHAFYKPV